jgi:hypothetical protein
LGCLAVTTTDDVDSCPAAAPLGYVETFLSSKSEIDENE